MRHNGFTLVELMVVLMVMALLGSAVVVTMGNSRGGVKKDAARLASRIAAARETSVTGGRPVSVWISRSGYGFDAYDGGRWTPLADGPLVTTDWKADTTVAVTGAIASGGRTQGQSRVIFDNLGLPDGPIRVRLSADGQDASIDVAGNGDVKVG